MLLQHYIAFIIVLKYLKTPNYFEYQNLFNIDFVCKNIDIILQEVLNIKDKWTPWPEKNLYQIDKEWTVFPLLHTFPGNDASKSVWLEGYTKSVPKTTALLQNIQGIRTALFSKMGAKTQLKAHRGWAELSNHVLRLHLPLIVPKEKSCGLCVRGEIKYHEKGKIICFDDSKDHLAFNFSQDDRIVLIFDIERPPHLPKGTATAGKTKDLEKMIELFK